MQTQLPSRGAAAAFLRTALPQSLDAPVRALIPPPLLQPLGLVFFLSFLPSLRLAAYIRASGEAEQNWPGGSPAQRGRAGALQGGGQRSESPAEVVGGSACSDVAWWTLLGGLWATAGWTLLGSQFHLP